MPYGSRFVPSLALQVCSVALLGNFAKRKKGIEGLGWICGLRGMSRRVAGGNVLLWVGCLVVTCISVKFNDESNGT